MYPMKIHAFVRDPTKSFFEPKMNYATKLFIVDWSIIFRDKSIYFIKKNDLLNQKWTMVLNDLL